MNVYDFDGTIYKGDSTIDFYFFCLRRHPAIVLQTLKKFPVTFAFLTEKIDKTTFKSAFYSFLQVIPNVEMEVEAFWKVKESNIQSWYLQQQKSDDVVVSASPEFLLRPICKEMGVSYLIASMVNQSSGECISANCRGVEKVKRFQEIFPEGQVESFYSDSESDMPMARLARNAYLVQNGICTKWL